MKFEIKQLKLPGVYRIDYNSYEDKRGKICTIFDRNLSNFLKESFNDDFIHDKMVVNKKNVLRGIHFDRKTTKLVTCLNGLISQYVICVDENSPIFGKYEVIEMEPMKCLVRIPVGYGNAFVSRKSGSIYHYKLAYQGEYTDATEQMTIKWNDPRLNIPWNGKNFILSNRDSE